MTAIFARVPATSANIGPGFDALGLALTLYADIGSTTADNSLPPKAHVIDDYHPATVAFRQGGGVGQLWERSAIPMGRGLGYSAAVRIGGLLAAHLQRFGPDTEQFNSDRRLNVLALATALEGHPDNAAPALMGGLVASAGGVAVRVPLGFDPAVVCWVPSTTTSTDHSRAQLGGEVAWPDAVFNVGRVALLVAACAAGDTTALRIATQDRLHQPTRFELAPDSRRAHELALEHGAWAAWLSGSGPTVAALCAPDQADRLAAALPANGHTKVLRIDTFGAHVVHAAC